MRLKYNILWFDDDKDWIESVIEEIESFLQEKGFILNYDNYQNATQFDEIIISLKANTKDVDIILMDYKLMNQDKGDVLIKKIREKEVLTEILFYSQDAHVRDKFKEECIEGIYFSNRSDFLDRFFQIIPHTIKKVLDLTNMRGLVMAETSSMDFSLNSIILKMINLLDKHKICKRQEIIDKIFHKRLTLAHQIKEIKEHEIIKINGKDKLIFNIESLTRNEYMLNIENLLDKIESSDKYQTINKLFNELKLKVKLEESYFNLFKKYDEEIIKIRNVLAHVHEETIDGKTTLKSKIKGYDEFIFSHDEFEKIRKSLILHLQNIENIDKEICKHS
ncbi:hypothetical protein [Aliarcobacter butzleri]|uniref:hypothetical protein n=1 Tax=Aliarcobacter butzleri TaxID=28197 RepID=UPI00344B7E1F